MKIEMTEKQIRETFYILLNKDAEEGLSEEEFEFMNKLNRIMIRLDRREK